VPAALPGRGARSARLESMFLESIIKVFPGAARTCLAFKV